MSRNLFQKIVLFVLPSLLLVLVTFSVFLMSSNSTAERTLLSTCTLLALVTMYSVTRNCVPPSGYVTVRPAVDTEPRIGARIHEREMHVIGAPPLPCIRLRPPPPPRCLRPFPPPPSSSSVTIPHTRPRWNSENERVDLDIGFPRRTWTSGC